MRRVSWDLAAVVFLLSASAPSGTLKKWGLPPLEERVMKKIAIVALLGLLGLIGPAGAQPPPDLLSQVVLKDSAGKPLTGTFSITFRLYNMVTGGTPLWTETHSRVSVIKGHFSVVLGSVTPYSPVQFSEPDRWLGMAVGSNPEMTPRLRISHVGNPPLKKR